MGFLSDLVKGITGAIGDVIGWLVGIEEPGIDDQSRGALVNKQSNIEPIPVIYGQRKVGGTRVFVSTGGAKKNEYLYIALALCEGEVEEIGDVYINDVLSTDSKYSGLVSITKYLGTDAQTYSTLLAEADDTWGSNHRLRGVAYLAMRFKYDPDVFSSIPEVQAVVKGRKVYDPETTTTVWSNNPALCLRDYLTNARYGKGLSSALIDDTSFIAAKAFCNTTVTSSAGAGGSQKIFECNAVIDTDKNLFDNVRILLRGMRGLMPYSNGIYSLIIDKSESSSFDLTPDNITSDLTVASAGKSKKYNKVTVKFTNPEANWQSDTVFWPPAGSTEETTFLSEDNNQELSTEITLPTITNYYSARDIARVACLTSRASDLSVKVTATSEALVIAAGDVVRLDQPSMGWVDDGVTDARQLFRVVGIQLVNTGEVKLTLQKYDSSIYTWDEGADEPTNQPTTLPDPSIVAPPTNLSVTGSANIAEDGTTIPYLAITWTAADDAFVSSYEITVTPSSGNATSLIVSTTAYDFFVLDSALTYSVSVRSINSLGIRSTAATVSGVSPVIDTTAPSVPSNPSVTGEFKQIKIEWDNPTEADFSYVEIKRSGTATEGDAVTIAVTRADYFIDGPYSGVTTRYYWLRAVDLSGNASAWVSAGSGTSVKLVADDFDDGVIDIDYLDTGLQTTLNNAVSTTTFTDGIDNLRQEILNVEVESGEVLNLEDGQDFLIQNLGDVAIYVNESNQIITASITNIESTVTGLENTIVDLVSGVSDVYVQATPPVAGVGSIPDPIPTFSRWYDSDDSNEPYYWNGTEWVSLADPRIASNAASITTLQSGLNTANSNISANSSAISVLDATTISQGNSIASLSSDVTTLQTDLTTAEGDITTNSTAISGLTTRVTSAEGAITTNASDITALETTVNDGTTGVAANASAISGLDTRVTTTEGAITTNATDITALESTVNNATTGVAATASGLSALDTRVTTAEGTISTNSTDITALETTVNDATNGVVANSTAISNLDSRVTTAEGTISSTASDTTALQVSFTDLTKIQGESDDVIQTEGGADLDLNLPTDVAQATSQVTTSLDARLTVTEGTITTQSSDITQLRSDLTSLDGDVTGNATAIDSLTTRVTTAEGSISANATDITALDASLTSAQGDITTNATAISSLDTRVTSAEGSITSQASDITALESDVTSLDTTVSGNSTAITSLDTRVTSAEGVITSQSSDITTLQSSVTDLETDTTNNSTAITSLDTRVTSAEGTITSQSSDITQLQSDVTSLNGDVSSNSTAITSLDTRVTSAEGSITSQATDITNIQSSITDIETDVSGNADAITGLTTRVTQTETDITSQASDLTELQTDVTNLATDVSGNADAITGIDTRVTSAEGSITSQAASITSLESSVTDLETNTTNNATAITNLDTRVTANETSITSQSSDITALESNVTSLNGTVSGNSTAISNLDTRVTSAEGTITSQSSDITSLQSSVTSLNTSVSGNATAISGIETRVTANEGDITSQATALTSLTSTVGTNTTSITNQQTTINGIKAQYTVTIDNNDHISGFGLVSDIIDGNPTSAFIVNADQFAIGGAGVITDEYPFVVYTTNTNVTKDGETYTIPAGAYIQDAFIQNAAIDSAQIRDAAITSAKIDDAAITSAKIEDAAINSAKIEDLSVGTIKIASGAVTNKYAAYTNAITYVTGTYSKTQELVDVEFSGGTVSIIYNFKLNAGNNNTIQIVLDGTAVGTYTGSAVILTQVLSGSGFYYYFPTMVTVALTVQPSAGTHTIEVFQKSNDQIFVTANDEVSQRFLQAVENKK
jgi:predicted  nucleic acid-binding Zn-ribbon protein